jgi:hypothetical protein
MSIVLARFFFKNLKRASAAFLKKKLDRTMEQQTVF